VCAAGFLTRRVGRRYEVERMRPLALCLAAVALVAARPAAAAPSVTLNGVPIDGVTSQTFDNCTVVIDEKGNIHIQAKGYAVRSAAGDLPRTPVEPTQAGSGGGLQGRPDLGAPGRLARRYFIATEQTPPGAQYDLGIFINAQWIREVKASEPQAVLEITKYLRPGTNKITFAATKRIVGERLAFGRDVVLRIVVGEGNVGGDHVMIDVPIVETSLSAAEVADKTEEFVIDAR
jgi:hypothetical protein